MKTLKEKISDYLWAQECTRQYKEGQWICEICSAVNDEEVGICHECHQVKDVH
jgi:hypothetical protein